MGTTTAEQKERYARGMRELLSALSEDVLKGILRTSTNSIVQYGSVPLDDNKMPIMDARTHAINSIMMYNDPLSLLNRVKMKRVYLSDYLNQKQVKMTMPSTKHSLCQDLLRYWGQEELPENVRLIDDEPLEQKRNRSDSKNDVLRRFSRPIEDNSGPSSYPGINGNSACANSLRKQSNVHQQNSLQSDRSAGTPNMNGAGDSNVERNLVQIHNAPVEYETAVSLRQKEAHLGQQLGIEFSAWYYERLNTLTDFTVNHFWPECNFRLEVVFANQPEEALIEETMMDGDACCAKIKDLVLVKQLMFNPNSVGGTGIRGYLNPHGLAQVMVCGIVFQKEGGSPIGVFEQMFGLMRDPSLHNNFRIKFTVLRMREGGHLALQGKPPELLDSSLVGIVEEMDSDSEDLD